MLGKRMTKIKKIALSVVCCCCMLCFMGAVRSVVRPSAEAELSEIEILSEYSMGEEIELPDATISLDGETYQTVRTLIMPDGTTVASDKAVLNQSGNYTILYKALINGKAVEKSVTFVVLNNMFEIKGEKSTVTYGTNAYLPEDVQGLNLSLAAGETFVYNHVIDVTDLMKSDRLIQFYVTPKEKGTGEFTSLCLKLTDVYDNNNFVTVKFNAPLADISRLWRYLYTSAAANGQDFKGLDWDPNTNRNTMIVYKDEKYDLFTNQTKGLESRTSFTGEIHDAYCPNGFIDNYDYLSFDYAERQLYAKYGYGGRDMIIDLDEPLFYEDNLWDGFTSNKVILSLYVEGLTASSANFFISDLYGADLSQNAFKDDVAPDIIVDHAGYEMNALPKAYVGKSYKLFDVVAIDNLEGAVDVSTQVYYNYYSGQRTQVALLDGAFIPKHTGTYTIVYTARDSIGNVARETLDVTCEDAQTTMQIVLGNRTLTTDVMMETTVARYGVTGANGNYAIEILARAKDGAEEILVDPQTRTFTPMNAGTYEIVYTASDYTHTVTNSYEIVVNRPALPVLEKSTDLPKYMIKGATYGINTVKAHDYSSATTKTFDAEIYIKEDGESAEIKYTNAYQVNASSSVTVIYKASNGNGTATAEYTVPVVDVKYGDVVNVAIKDYFQGVGFVSELKTDHAFYVRSYDGAVKAQLDFINSVDVNNFRWSFAIPDGYWNFNSLDLVLTSTTDASERLTVTFEKAGTQLRFFVNGYKGKVFSFDYTLGETIDLVYNKIENLLMVNGSYTYDLKTSRGVFDGFTGNLAEMNVAFNGVNGDVAIGISRLLTQSFFTGALDFNMPAILERQEVSFAGKINETITLFACDYFDLFDPNLTVTFSAYGPDGETLTSVDGVLLDNADPHKDHQILLDAYGTYEVQYSAKDFAGNINKYSYVVTVKDRIAPTVTLSDSYTTTCKKGDTVTVASVTATDDTGGECSYYTVVVKPGGVVETFDETFVADTWGVYHVYYYVSDVEGNVTLLSYQVTAG